MSMSYTDAELFFDGRIAPAAVDPKAISKFTALANAVRQGTIAEKPVSVLARMALVMEARMLAGCLTDGDLTLAGFSRDEIETHQAQALQVARLANPSLQTAEWAA